jgi:hypothetical protein
LGQQAGPIPDCWLKSAPPRLAAALRIFSCTIRRLGFNAYPEELLTQDVAERRGLCPG